MKIFLKWTQKRMAVQKLLRLGNPRLYEVSRPVERQELSELTRVVTDLHDTLMHFRDEWGPARAVAAPQIGVLKRLVYMFTDEPTVFINPVLSNFSSEMIELWDDCMSFPELLVRVRRYKSCTVTYRDLDWNEHSTKLTSLSELLQHECDHLEGILAISHAIDSRSIVLKTEREYAIGLSAN